REETMKTSCWSLVALLVVLHHDFWFWDDGTLVGGLLPIGLLYHMGISVAAAIAWLLATKYAWPLDSAAESDADATASGADA
ncbi:MAG: DUF3311 domain-containing protein, partial [Planctomycetota bacterium]|nr:DUF3311 domain-containing protein [Planctomycetota bacterium]